MSFTNKEIVERIRAAKSPEELGDIIVDLMVYIRKLESTISNSSERDSGIDAALTAWERNGAPNRRSLTAFGLEVRLSTPRRETSE